MQGFYPWCFLGWGLWTFCRDLWRHLWWSSFMICFFQHIGPAIPEVSSIWFKLYLYSITGQGPPSLLLSKGSRLRKLPDIFQVGVSIQIFFFFFLLYWTSEFTAIYLNMCLTQREQFSLVTAFNLTFFHYSIVISVTNQRNTGIMYSLNIKLHKASNTVL